MLGMNFLREYCAVIEHSTNKLTLRRPVPSPEDRIPVPAAVRDITGQGNLLLRSSVVVLAKTNKTTCGQALLEGNVFLLLDKGIRFLCLVAQDYQRRRT